GGLLLSLCTDLWSCGNGDRDNGNAKPNRDGAPALNGNGNGKPKGSGAPARNGAAGGARSTATAVNVKPPPPESGNGKPGAAPGRKQLARARGRSQATR